MGWPKRTIAFVPSCRPIHPAQRRSRPTGSSATNSAVGIIPSEPIRGRKETTSGLTNAMLMGRPAHSSQGEAPGAPPLPFLVRLHRRLEFLAEFGQFVGADIADRPIVQSAFAPA